MISNDSVISSHGCDTREVEVLSITPVENRGSLRAFVNIRVGVFILNGCRIVQEDGKKAWISLPVLSYKDEYGTTQYKTLVQILDENLKNQISKAVLLLWENTKGGSDGN